MIKYKMINSIVVISNIMLLFYLFRCSLSYLSKSVRGFILNNLTWEQNKRRKKQCVDKIYHDEGMLVKW